MNRPLHIVKTLVVGLAVEKVFITPLGVRNELECRTKERPRNPRDQRKKKPVTREKFRTVPY